MIQEIYPALNNQYQDLTAEGQDRILTYFGKDIYIGKGDETVIFPRAQEIEDICQKQGLEKPEFRYYFSIGQDRYFGYEAREALPEGDFCYHRMFSLRAMQPMDAVMAASTGWHLNTWYGANHYCGACGSRTVHDKTLRMVKCPACGNMIFPKLLPAVIVGVKSGDYIMLTKYKDREYTRYALIAGFVEIGESVEATVAREVYEEVGLHVKNITYYKSQPWGFDGDILMGYFCDVDGDIEVTMDTEELSRAQWVHYSQVPEYDNLSLTSEMMKYFKRNH